MSLHSRIDKTLDELLDVSIVINYLGQNITFPRLAVAQARISGKAEGRAKGLAEGLAKGVEQGNLEMAKLVHDKLIPDLETRANESLRNLGEKFITTLGGSGIRGTLVRDKITGLPIKVHPTIKDMFPVTGSPYYSHLDIARIKGQRGKLKQPEVIWSATTDKSVAPDITQEKWEGSGRRFSRYHTGKLMVTQVENRLLSKLENLPIGNILQDMWSKIDWNRSSREFVTNLRALPPPPPPPP